MPTIIRPRNPDEPKHLSNGVPQVLYQAKIGALLALPMLEDQGEGYIERVFEQYVRPPGVRAITVNEKNEIFLQHEFRYEKGDFDWRLPGGKVFDSFDDFFPYIGKNIPEEMILNAAVKELREEAHLDAKPSYFIKKICGATVQWDLYYVVMQEPTPYQIDYIEKDGHHNKETAWLSLEKVEAMCYSGEINEAQTAIALLQWVKKRNK